MVDRSVFNLVPPQQDVIWADTFQYGVKDFVLPGSHGINQAQALQGRNVTKGPSQAEHAQAQQGSLPPQTSNVPAYNHPGSALRFFVENMPPEFLRPTKKEKVSDKVNKHDEQTAKPRGSSSKRSHASTNEVSVKSDLPKISFNQLMLPPGANIRQRRVHVQNKDYPEPCEVYLPHNYLPAYLKKIWRPKDPEKIQDSVRKLSPGILFVLFEGYKSDCPTTGTKSCRIRGCRTRGICLHYSVLLSKGTPDGLICGICKKAGIEEGYLDKRPCAMHNKRGDGDVRNMHQDFLATPEQVERAAEFLQRVWQNKWELVEERPRGASNWELVQESSEGGRAEEYCKHNERIAHDVCVASPSNCQHPIPPTERVNTSFAAMGPPHAGSQENAHRPKRIRAADLVLI